LCGGSTQFRFTRTILGSLECGYHECTSCRGLQTDTPTWLDRSYSAEFHGLGLESAARSIWSQALVAYLFRVLGARGKILDFGGGVGLLCRLLRDIGHDAYLFDIYSTNIYAQGFAGEPEANYAMVTAFEVFEHFAHPLEDASKLFQGRPDFVVVGTGLYRGQGSDWDYLFPDPGQHVFFWSAGAHRWLAKQLGYHVVTVGKTITVYSRAKVGPIRSMLAQGCEIGAKLTQMVLPLAGRPGVARDEKRLSQPEPAPTANQPDAARPSELSARAQ